MQELADKYYLDKSKTHGFHDYIPGYEQILDSKKEKNTNRF